MWNLRKSPSRIEKKFEFDSYSKISKFMEAIEEHCKDNEIFPNISFAKNFVSIVIFIDSEAMSTKEKNFSVQIDNFFTRYK